MILIPLFACFLLSYSPPPTVSSQATALDGYLFPGEGLLGYTPLATTNLSFCFDSNERVIVDLDHPLYPQPIVQGYLGTSELGAIWQYVANILLTEIIGLRTLWYDSSNAPENPLQVFELPVVWNGLTLLANFTADAGYLDTYTTTEAFTERLIGPGLLLQQVGIMSTLDQESIFVDYRTVLSNPTLDLLSWTSYSKGTAYNPYFKTLYFPYSPERDAAITRNINASIDSAWDFVTSGEFAKWNSDAYFGLGCPVDAIYTEETGGLYGGCNDPKYPSMYIPPQCYPNPEQQCTVWYTLANIIGGNYYASAALALNLSVCIGYFDFEFLDRRDVWNASFPINIVASTQFQDGVSICQWYDSLSNMTVPVTCYRPIVLPPYDSSCLLQFDGSVNSSYPCAEEETPHYRIVRTDLNTTAPRAYYLIQNMDFNSVQSSDMIHNSGKDLRENACVWLQGNRNVWSKWILPPAECVSDDYYVVDYGCDESTSQRLFAYYWHYPKACQGGVMLPASESFSCGYLSFNNIYTVAPLVTFAIVGGLLFLIFIRMAFRREVDIKVNKFKKIQPTLSNRNVVKSILFWLSKVFPTEPSFAIQKSFAHSVVLNMLQNYDMYSKLLILFLPFPLLVSFVALLSPVSETSCALRFQGYWIFMQIGMCGLLNHMLFKFWYVQRRVVISNTSYTYWTPHFITASTGILIVILMAVDNSTPRAQWATQTLQGNYMYTFAYCRLPSVWVLWIAVIPLLLSWTSLLVLSPAFYVLYMFRSKNNYKLFYNKLITAIGAAFVLHTIVISSWFEYLVSPHFSEDVQRQTYLWIGCELVFLLLWPFIFSAWDVLYAYVRPFWRQRVIPIDEEKKSLKEKVKLPVSIHEANINNVDEVLYILNLKMPSYFKFHKNTITTIHNSFYLKGTTPIDTYSYQPFEFLEEESVEISVTTSHSTSHTSSSSRSSSIDVDNGVLEPLSSLNNILKHSVVQVLFMMRLQHRTCACEENLKFLISVKKLGRILFQKYTLDKEGFIYQMQYILQQFILPNSNQQLNISDVKKKEFTAATELIQSRMTEMENTSIAPFELRCLLWVSLQPIVIEIIKLIEDNNVLSFASSNEGQKAMEYLKWIEEAQQVGSLRRAFIQTFSAAEKEEKEGSTV